MREYVEAIGVDSSIAIVALASLYLSGESGRDFRGAHAAQDVQERVVFIREADTQNRKTREPASSYRSCWSGLGTST